MVSDEQSDVLLERARAGSRDALGSLFERHSPRLLALIRLRLGPRLRARLESRDILHASLLKAVTHLDAFEGSGSLGAWLVRIAENEIRDQAEHHGRERRDAGREVPLDDAASALAANLRSQTSRLVLDEKMQRLERALESLDDGHREVILLRRFEELGFKEIGERLGKSPDACRMLLARAMTALTLRMREEP
jgi:RNA polymerase sigma-70 factor (ECF subfamily)